jgi:2-polyprenyl-3-methyl-5-hydroxy-6-metoxy-1,4-benzoquinol methylase
VLHHRVVFLQTIEHVQDPDAVLDHIRELIGPRGVAYVSTPNVLTLAPPGAEKSDNPWHLREYTAEEFEDTYSWMIDNRLVEDGKRDHRLATSTMLEGCSATRLD